MLIADVPVLDHHQLFQGTIQYHIEFGWVRIGEVDGDMAFIELLDGSKKKATSEFTDDLFKIKAPSLGYVNIEIPIHTNKPDVEKPEIAFKVHNEPLGKINWDNIVAPNLVVEKPPVEKSSVAVYLSRYPARVMKAGVVLESLKIDVLRQISLISKVDISNRLVRKEYSLIEAFNNRYPSFEEALRKVKENPKKFTMVAFDRQFAVSSALTVYYRNTLVGNVNDHNCIQYFPQYANLRFSEGNYHEAIQAVKKAARQRVVGN